MQYFPSRNELTKKEFLNRELQDFHLRGDFYCDRLTDRQERAKRQQLTFPYK